MPLFEGGECCQIRTIHRDIRFYESASWCGAIHGSRCMMQVHDTNVGIGIWVGQYTPKQTTVIPNAFVDYDGTALVDYDNKILLYQ